MVSILRLSNAKRGFADFGRNIRLIPVVFHSTGHPHGLSLNTRLEIDRITKVINDHPFPDVPIQPALSYQISPPTLSIPLVENVLGRLFASHANGLKAYEFFHFCFKFTKLNPSPCSVEMTLHILARMRYLDKAWEFLEEIRRKDPSLLTLKSMSIMLSRIAKFKSYEDTLEAFERMEKSIFVGRNFGTDEFNVLLRAFCTQRQMKEAKSVFQKMHSRFPPNTKTMNILLLGFKESGPLTAVELFYHEMIRRGFEPSLVTYNIRIDAYCKYGSLGDGLRLFKEMDGLENCSPTLATITTLIHGAGIARNKTKAWDLFHEISKRNLTPDIGAYNALISTLVKCRDLESALVLIDEAEKRCIALDNITYHTLFYGLMRTAEGMKGVVELFDRMMRKNFVPKTRTVVMLMKFFCQHRRVDLALQLWEYQLDRGSCPHDHALALLVGSLCAEGRWQEAFECSKQMLARGRQMSEPVFRMLERPLLEAGEEDKVKVLGEMMEKLKTYCPT